MASEAATTPSWISRDITFRNFFSYKYLSGSKSCISAASLVGSDPLEMERNGPMPDTPWDKLLQNASFPIPMGETTPTPVITILGMVDPAVIA